MVTSLLPHLISLYLDCFCSFELLVVLYGSTNVYLREKTSHLKPSYSTSWAPIPVDEFCNYIALLFYMPIVTDLNISAYWSQSYLYCGLWAKHFMAIQIDEYFLITDCMLEDTNNDKLDKSKIFV